MTKRSSRFVQSSRTPISEFFLHMDVTNDGTAGCIGIPPGQEGKFNQIMSLIATNKSDVKLNVSY